MPPPAESHPQNSVVYTVTNGEDITDSQLTECAQLFSNNYGIWSEEASQVSRFLKPGSRVKMTASRLRAQSVADPAQTRLATARVQGILVAHAFATRWTSPSGVVGWITQLVVDLKQRRRYHATMLLQVLRHDMLLQDASIFGIVSSHPASCNALVKLGRVPIDKIDLDFIKEHAAAVLGSSTVEYLKTAELHGSLFNSQDTTGAVSTVMTNYWVDHTEPLEALKSYRSRSAWCLGDLLGGHEFLVMVPAPPVK